MTDPVIQMTKAELDAYIAEGVKKGLADSINGDDNTRILKRVTERTVEVRLVDNKVVVGFKNRGQDNRPVYIYEKPNPNNPKEMISYVDLILEGNEVMPSIDFTQFRRESMRAKCPIKKMEQQEWTINQGVTTAKTVGDADYHTTDLDYDVPVDVTGFSRVYTVEIPKGYGGTRQIAIQESMINIA